MSKIGVVVREQRLLQLLRSRLQAAGGEILASSNGIDALNWVKDKAIEILVIDLHLDEPHGDDVCKEIKGGDALFKIPVVMLIEEDDTWFRARCEEAKADVVMPYKDAKDITATIDKILNSEKRVSTPGAVEYYFVDSRSKQMYKGKVVDVSTAGVAFDATQCELEKDMQVDVRLRLPNLEPVMGRCTVVRVQPPRKDEVYHVSLKWSAFKKGDRERLAAWINAKD